MTLPAQPESNKALEKALDALRNAEYDLKGGFKLATANRAYYSCYYCMTALLYTKDIYAKTHQGIRGKFSEHFIKPRLFLENSSEIISLLFDNRQEADYDLDANITLEEANNLIKNAKTFYALTLEYFETLKNQYK